MTGLEVGIINGSGGNGNIIEGIDDTLGSICKELLILRFLGQGKTVLVILFEFDALNFKVLIVFRDEDIEEPDLSWGQLALMALEIDFSEDWEFGLIEFEYLFSFSFGLFFIAEFLIDELVFILPVFIILLHVVLIIILIDNVFVINPYFLLVF